MINIEEYRKFLLSERDFDRLNKISEEIINEWDGARRAFPYTPHDHTHCEKVEEKLYQLIPKQKMKDSLSPDEIFLLLASVWVHDIGMKPDLFESDKKLHELRKETDTLKWDKSVREKHAERSATWVKTNWKRLGFNNNEIRQLIKMCELHRHRAYKQLHDLPWITEEEPNIRIQLLIAYLRLADSLHIPQKAEASELKIYLALGLDPISKFHWFKSRYTDHIKVLPEEFKIIIVFKKPDYRSYPGEWDEKLTSLKEAVTKEVRDELDSVKEILSKGGLSVYFSIESTDIEDRMMSTGDVQELEELVNNIELFDPTLTPNASSVISTVLKQINLLIDPDLNNFSKSFEYLREYRENVLEGILEKRSCHVFLRKVNDMLKENLRGDSENNKEIVRDILEKIKIWKKERENSINIIPKIAFGILADGLPILLYGYSESIVKCIEYYLKQKRSDLTMYICEGRTKTTYRYNNRIIYCDGIKYALELKKTEKKVNEELNKEGKKEKVRLNINYITDSCASNLFSRGQITKVIFGADGIALNGRVAHTLGHLAIADMALVYGAPVYVIADTMKIGFLLERPELKRGNQWLTTDIEYESILDKLIYYNPREDIVPPDKIEAFITERGQIKPSLIRQYYNEQNQTKVDEFT